MRYPSYLFPYSYQWYLNLNPLVLQGLEVDKTPHWFATDGDGNRYPAPEVSASDGQWSRSAHDSYDPRYQPEKGNER